MISDEAKDFIRQLMQPDQIERINVKQALKHPWLTKAPNDSELDLEKFKKFVAQYKMKQTLVGFFAQRIGVQQTFD